MMSAEICPIDTKGGPVLALAALSLPVNPADKAHFMAIATLFFETARTDPPPCTGPGRVARYERGRCLNAPPL